MSFESFRATLGTTDTMVYQMPAYTKTEDGEYALLPKSGAVRFSVYNSDPGQVTLTVKLKTIFDLDPVTIGVITIDAGDIVQWPVPVSLGPGDYVVASGSTAAKLTISGTVAASPIAPQTASGETIWTNFVMRRPIDHTLAWAIASRTYGAAAAGGYFGGMIDTVAGTIDAADAYQTGQRFAVLVGPKSMEVQGASVQWDNRGVNAPLVSAAMTRWDGLSATAAILALGDLETEAANVVHAYNTSQPAPDTMSGSIWYLPAMDELETLYRNLKPKSANNRTDSQAANGGSFPSPLSGHGTNISADPVTTTYTNNPPDPDESPLALFKAGGAQVLGQLYYWSSTEADQGQSGVPGESYRAWAQLFTDSGSEGYQYANLKDTTLGSVRPVRRVVL